MKRNALLPSHAIGTVERGFGRLFEDLTAGLGASAGTRLNTPVDLVETPEAWLVTADLPGVAEDAIELSVEDGVLRISAQRATEVEGEDAQTRWTERATGRFMRALRLPGEFDAEAVTAKLQDGVLSVTLPKANAAKPRTITVERA